MQYSEYEALWVYLKLLETRYTIWQNKYFDSSIHSSVGILYCVFITVH